MKSIITSRGTEIKIFSSPKELPIGRYSDFQKYLANSFNIVGTLNRAKAFSQESQFENCEIEIDNAIYQIEELSKGISTTGLAFAVMIYSINGIVRDDTSEDGLKETLSLIGDISQYEIEIAIEDVKKK
jgi:hypothetical protein